MALNVDDTKWFMHSNLPTEGTVVGVCSATNTDADGSVSHTAYRMNSGTGFHQKDHGVYVEGSLFDTKQALFDSL